MPFCKGKQTDSSPWCRQTHLKPEKYQPILVAAFASFTERPSFIAWITRSLQSMEIDYEKCKHVYVGYILLLKKQVVGRSLASVVCKDLYTDCCQYNLSVQVTLMEVHSVLQCVFLFFTHRNHWPILPELLYQRMQVAALQLCVTVYDNMLEWRPFAWLAGGGRALLYLCFIFLVWDLLLCVFGRACHYVCGEWCFFLSVATAPFRHADLTIGEILRAWPLLISAC